MRPRINRLVYLLIGAALAAGLLVSLLVRPEPRLVSSENCYGLCPSVTTLWLSSSTIIYGNEQYEKFSVKVTGGAPGTGVPTGSMVVESGSKILCSIQLYRGTGSCSPVARSLTRGSYLIVAHYSGDKNFMPSTSSPKSLTVLRHSSRRNPSLTSLSLSSSPQNWDVFQQAFSSRVAYNNEPAEKFSVMVIAGSPWAGGPTGSVVMESGTKILCSIDLHRGTGSCLLAPKELAPGSYRVVANYSGDNNFKPSMSSPATLTVLRH
jgi:hypothetical protein